MRLTYFFNHKSRYNQRAWGLRMVYPDGTVGMVAAYTVHSTKAECVTLRREAMKDGRMRGDVKWEVVPVRLKIEPEH